MSNFGFLNINFKKTNSPAPIKKLTTGVINITPAINHNEDATLIPLRFTNR